MGPYYGNVRIGQEVEMLFESVDADGGESDFDTPDPTWRVYKQGTAIQKALSAGDFDERYDSLTGIHQVVIDTSSDAAFYEPGFDYHVVGVGLVINGEQFKVVLGSFSIDNRDNGIVYHGEVTNTPADGATFRDSTLSTTDEAYTNMLVVFITGSNGSPVPIPRRVEGYTGSTREFSFAGDPFPFTIGNGDRFKLFGRAD